MVNNPVIKALYISSGGGGIGARGSGSQHISTAVRPGGLQWSCRHPISPTDPLFFFPVKNCEGFFYENAAINSGGIVNHSKS